MRAPPLLTETAVRDSFLAAVARSGTLFGVVGEDGLARQPSVKFRGRETSLLWASEDEASAWAQAVTVHPRIKRYRLSEALSDLLPGLARHRRLIGLGFDGMRVAAELDAQDMAERLRLAALEQFLEAAVARQAVFTLEGATGPAMLVSQTRSDILVLPCWSEPGDALARLEGPWRDMMLIENPLQDFINRRLSWLQLSGYLAAPGYLGGSGALEMQPSDLKSCFSKRHAAA
jgi:hypothetical protein